MGSLEFRCPQFSEDLAWLPGWLQQHRAEESVEHIKHSQVLPNPASEDVLFSEEDIAGQEKEDQFSREGRYSHCRLFLSGENNSPISSSSKENVLKLNLRLSTDVESVCCSTQQPDSLDKLVAVSEVLPCFIVETPFAAGNIPCSLDAHLTNKINISSVPIPETEMNDSVLEYPKFKVNRVEWGLENSKVKCEEDTDICNAVELSIAASEALVLHNLVKEGQFSETFPAKAVLEVALRVKQARLDELDDDFHQPSLECDLTESLSDLDDSMMADAYDDVGISYGIPSEQYFHSSDFSKANRMKENHLGKNNSQCIETEHKMQDVNICSNFEKNYHEANMGPEVGLKGALPSEPLRFQMQKLPDTERLLVNVSKLDRLPMLSEAKFDVLDQLGVNQTAGWAKAFTSQQTDFHSGNFRDKERTTYLASDRFRSHWLSGWTDKGDARRISAHFIHETSFLSESAEIVPDENSVVQKQDFELEHSTLPSAQFEWLHKKLNESILQSQEAMSSSSTSLLDPLCSVVPCSIPAEADAGNECEKNTDNRVAASSEFNVGYCMSNQDKVIVHKEDIVHTVPFINVEKLQIITPTDCKEEILLNSSVFRQTYQKQSTSLKSYSMILPKPLFPSNVGYLKYNHLNNAVCKWKLQSDKHWTGSTNFLDKSSSDEFLPSGSISAGKHEKSGNENMACSSHLQLDMKITHEKRSLNGEGPNEIEIPIEVPKEKRSPVILNRRSRHRLLASKTIIEDAAIGKNLMETLPLETVVPAEEKSTLHKTQKQRNSPCVRHVLAGKRVHFSEAEQQLPHKNYQELQLSGPTAKAGKRRKHSKSFISVQAHENKNSLLNPYTEVRKQMIFQGIEFLLTGYSIQKEKDIEGLIRNFGGIVVCDMPSPSSSRGKRNTKYNFLQLPVLLCSRKLQTTKFLYACAINALILKVDWLTDCVAAGIILQPEKYMILPNRINVTLTRVGEPVSCSSQKYMFEGVGIMLNGKHSFCTKLEMIVKHGGGYVFKSIHRLIQYINNEKISTGAIVVEDKGRASRHLKHCALELKIPVMPASWFVKSLHSGKLLPFFRENKTSLVPKRRELSVEI